MSFTNVVLRMRQEKHKLSPVQIALLLSEMHMDGLTQSALIFSFKQAFPEIPLRQLLEAGAWNRVSSGKLSDDDFNKLLDPWLKIIK